MSLNSINYNRELGILNLVIDRPALFRSLVLEFRVSGEDVLAVKYFFFTNIQKMILELEYLNYWFSLCMFAVLFNDIIV